MFPSKIQPTEVHLNQLHQALININNMFDMEKNESSNQNKITFKKSIVIMGEPGSGKTSLAQLLANYKFIAQKTDTDQIKMIAIDQNGQQIISPSQIQGQGISFQFPRKYQCMHSQEISIWDFPPMQDQQQNNFHVQDLINSYSLYRVQQHSEQLKICLVVPECHMMLNGQEFLRTLHKLLQIITQTSNQQQLQEQISKLAPSIILIITQAEPNKQVQQFQKIIEKFKNDKKLNISESHKLILTNIQTQIEVFHKPQAEGQIKDQETQSISQRIFKQIELTQYLQHKFFINIPKTSIELANQLQETCQQSLRQNCNQLTKKILEYSGKIITGGLSEAISIINDNKSMIQQQTPDTQQGTQQKQKIYKKQVYYIINLLTFYELIQPLLQVPSQDQKQQQKNIVSGLIQFGETATILASCNFQNTEVEAILQIGIQVQNNATFLVYLLSIQAIQQLDLASIISQFPDCSNNILKALQKSAEEIKLDPSETDKNYYLQFIRFKDYCVMKPKTQFISAYIRLAMLEKNSEDIIQWSIKAIKESQNNKDLQMTSIQAIKVIDDNILQQLKQNINTLNFNSQIQNIGLLQNDFTIAQKLFEPNIRKLNEYLLITKEIFQQIIIQKLFIIDEQKLILSSNQQQQQQESTQGQSSTRQQQQLSSDKSNVNWIESSKNINKLQEFYETFSKFDQQAFTQANVPSYIQAIQETIKYIILMKYENLPIKLNQSQTPGNIISSQKEEGNNQCQINISKVFIQAIYCLQLNAKQYKELNIMWQQTFGLFNNLAILELLIQQALNLLKEQNQIHFYNIQNQQQPAIQTIGRVPKGELDFFSLQLAIIDYLKQQCNNPSAQEMLKTKFNLSPDNLENQFKQIQTLCQTQIGFLKLYEKKLYQEASINFTSAIFLSQYSDNAYRGLDHIFFCSNQQIFLSAQDHSQILKKLISQNIEFTINLLDRRVFFFVQDFLDNLKFFQNQTSQIKPLQDNKLGHLYNIKQIYIFLKQLIDSNQMTRESILNTFQQILQVMTSFGNAQLIFNACHCTSSKLSSSQINIQQNSQLLQSATWQSSINKQQNSAINQIPCEIILKSDINNSPFGFHYIQQQFQYLEKLIQLDSQIGVQQYQIVRIDQFTSNFKKELNIIQEILLKKINQFDFKENQSIDYYQQLENVIILFSQDKVSLFMLTQCYFQQAIIMKLDNNQKKAIEILQKAIIADDNLKQLCTNTSDQDYYNQKTIIYNLLEKLGDLFMDTQDYQQAIVYFKKNNNYVKVKQCFELQIKQDSGNYQLYEQKGDYFVEQDLQPQAKEAYLEAKGLCKDNQTRKNIEDKIKKLEKKQ